MSRQSIADRRRRRAPRARVLLGLVTLLVAAAMTQPMTGIPILPERTALAFGCPTQIQLVNGSFESPVLPPDNATTPAGWQNLSLGGWYVPDSAVPGWTTTASDTFFEIWKSGRRGVPSVAGNQFAELNATQASTVSQSIDTSSLQGQTIEYSFWHRGRNGVDTMKIELGPTGGTPNFTRQVSTGNTAWVQYTGSYTVPVGQTSTRFAYGAVSAVGGAQLGNFLDDIRFGTPPCGTDLSVTKTATPAKYIPGQPVTFTITITNTGKYPGQYDVVGATLTDTVPAAITGVTWTCSASSGSSCGAASGSGNSISTTYNILEGGTVTYTVTGTAPVSGTPDPLTNTATVALPASVSDLDPSNNAATATIPRAVAALDLTKSSGSTGVPLPPGTITYRFSVTNTGDVPLTNVTVTDPRIGTARINCGGDGDNVIPTMAVAATVVCTAVYPVTLLDLLGINNTAAVTGTAPPGIPAPSDTSTANTPFVPAPGVNVDKTSNAAEPVSVGNVVTYSYAVRNTGNVPLNNVTVTDPHGGLSTINCGGDGNNVIEQMFPGGPITCTAAYTVTQADVDAGQIDNTASVSGTPTTGGAAVTDIDPLTVNTVDPEPAVGLVKTANFADPVQAGDMVTYSFEVTNTGNVTLSDVRVRDPLPGLSPVDCGGGTNQIPSLAPGDPSVTCTATYRVTQADIDRGGVTNTASATGTPPPGSPPLIQVFSGDNVPIAQEPAVSIEKSSDATDALAVGDTVTFTFSVSNTGNVTLNFLTVDDPLPGMSDIDCDGDNVIASIAPGAAPVLCTATYVVTAADIPSFSNTVTVNGTPPGSTVPVSDSDTISSPVTADPELTLVKVADGPDPVTVGDEITYTFEVTNSGNVTLTDVTVTDPLPGLTPIDCGDDGDNVIPSFAPGGPITCTAAYTVTQADVDNGEVANTATATGTPPPGSPPLTPAEDSVTVSIDRTPALDLVKSSDVATPAVLVAGDTITYTFSVTNTGNVDLTDVTVTDTSLPGMSAIDCDGDNVIAAMAPGDNVECTATYEVTQDDVDNGIVHNEASVSGTPPGGLTPPTDTAEKNTPFDPAPGVELEKSADFDTPVAVGDVITYAFAVTNTGNVSLLNVTVDDPLAGLSTIDCGDGTNVIARMAPGGPRTCTATYTVTQDDVDDGSIVNTASVSGTPFLGGDPVTDDSSATVPIPPMPSLSLDKTADTAGPVSVGDVITYTFDVVNTGNVTLDDVTVTDGLAGISPIDCGGGTNVVASVAPAGTAACTATYTVTQADVDSGGVANAASVTGTPPGSDDPITPVTDRVIVPGDLVSSLTLDKVSTSAPALAGDVISYDFVVDNTGTVTLTGITVTDDSLAGLSPIDCGDGTNVIASLTPDDPPATCTATYTVTQADVDTGQVDNTASATGTPPDGAPPVTPAGDSETVDIVQTAALSMTKSSDAINPAAAGQLVTFSFSVTNTGNVTLTDVTVVDTSLPGISAVDCGDGTNVIALMAPGAAPVECTATYVLTQEDLDGGTITNTATVTGTPPDGMTPPTATDSVESPFDAEPGLTIDKSSDAAEPVAAGDVITYSYAVQNTGNVTLTDVTVTDPHSGLSAIDCGGDGDAVIERFVPGGPVTCTATYTVTQADVDTGSIANTGSVTGTTPRPDIPAPTATDDLVVDTEDPAPALSLAKTSDAAEPVSVGDVITYSFAVDNTGNVTLHDVVVTDPHADLSAIDCGGGSATIATLAPADAPVTCTATYTVTQADVDAGSIANTASVTGEPPGSDIPIDPVTDDLVVDTEDPAPALSLAKTSDAAEPVSVGDVITYSFAVDNTGNVTLHDVVVSDPLGGLSAIDCGGGSATIATLAPADAPVSCTATYTVTQADVDAGSIANTASVTGEPPGSDIPIDPVTDDLVIDADQVSALTLDKTPAPASGVAVGDTVTYSFVVENTGTVTLTDVTVTDPMAGVSPIDCGPADNDNVIETLAPDDAAVTCTATYTVTQADVDNGEVANTASATGTPPPGAPTPPPAESSADVPIAAAPGLSFDKTSDAAEPVSVGDVTTYSFAVENTGNVTLSDVTVTDPHSGLSAIDCGPADNDNVIETLAPDDAAVTCTATYSVTQADADAGTISNTASVTGTPPGSDDPIAPVTDDLEVAVEQISAMTLDKSSSPTSGGVAGDTITYSFVVTNTGTVTLTDVTVTDPLAGLSAIDCGPADNDNVVETLTPQDGPVTCTATYTLTQADVDSGAVTNTATASGSPPAGAPPLTPAEDTNEHLIPAGPALSLDKSSTPAGPVGVGQVITYSFAVTNTGNVTLTDVTVTDPKVGLSAIDCGGGSSVIATLAPAGTVTCNATYTTTQADVDAGSIANTASVTGIPPGSQTPIGPATDTEVVDAGQPSGLTLDKTSSVSGNAAGEVITYTFVVTNTGAVTLSNVAVSDTLAGLSPVSCDGGGSTVATLAPSASATCTASYTLTQADIDNGTVVNSATASGTDPGGNPVADDASVTTPVAGASGIRLDKTSGGVNDIDANGVDAGDTITYFFVVTNTGTATLDGITVNDPRLGGAIPCGSGPLAPGAFRECDAAVYVLTESDFGTTLQNTATVTGTTPGGSVLSDTGLALTLIPPACSAVTTTSTSTTSTTVEPTETTELAGVVPTESSEPTETSEPESTQPVETTDAPTTTETPTTTDAPTTTEVVTTTTEAPTTTAVATTTEGPTDPAGFRQAPAQVDPCAPPATTTTSTTIATGPGPGPGPSTGGGGGTLPATGGEQGSTVVYAIAVMAAGVVTLLLVKRRRPTS